MRCSRVMGSQALSSWWLQEGGSSYAKVMAFDCLVLCGSLAEASHAGGLNRWRWSGLIASS